MLFKILIVCLLLFSNAFAMTDNGDGTRTFYVGSGGDYTTIADLVWVHPVGITAGDTLRDMQTLLVEDLTAQASGTSALPITITVAARSFSDGGYSYLQFISSISKDAIGAAFSITAADNKIYNCTIFSPVGDGVELTANTEIKNTIFEDIGGDDINENGGTATVDSNYADSDGDPLFVNPTVGNFGLSGNSPAKDTGAVLYTYAAHPGDYYGRKIYGAGPDIGAVEYEDHTPGGWFFEFFMPTIMKLCASTNAACYIQP